MRHWQRFVLRGNARVTKITLGLLMVAFVGIVACQGAVTDESSATEDSEERERAEGPLAAELQGITGWINAEPFTLASLRGKVVLIDFWTYTCVNCIRTFPFLRDWHEKYADKGLVIVGVHSPEFDFEKKTENVVNATQTHGLEYPVVQDNDFKTWRAYDNRFWPAKKDRRKKTTGGCPRSSI